MKIAILSLNSYNILSDSNVSQHVGGAETQIVSVGEGLARRGHEVSFICLDHGQPDGIEVSSGIRVFKSFAPDSGLPGIRFVYPKITSTWSALSRANPDVCIQAGADSWTGVAAAWCRKHKRRFVFVVMSDADCDIKLPFLKTFRDRALFRFGVKRAGGIVAQTDVQQEMLSKNFGLTSSVIRPSARISVSEVSEDNTKHVLWIGRFSLEKRLEWLLDIAEACPEFTFHVVGGANSETEYSKELSSRMENLPNVVGHGYISHDKMAPLYHSMGILLSTSVCEGFPTIFIEAWSCGIPVISTIDPDGVIAKYGLGRTADNKDGLIQSLKEIVNDHEKWLKISAAAKQYYKTNHTQQACVPKFEKMFVDV